MPRLRSNVLANYAGQIWVAFMGFAFVPVYLQRLGTEQFGLIAFMLSLQAMSLLLDLGAGVFLNRELAQRAHDSARRDSIRQLIRSFEWLVWPMTIIIATSILVASDAISTYWLNPQQLTRADASTAVKFIGMVVALLWPTSFYAATLSGLEQQPRLNVLVMIFATLRYAGVIPVLYFTNTGLSGFLCWHAVIAAAQTACTGWLLWRNLPHAAQPPRFDLKEILAARHFALGVFAVTALGLLLSQLDRLSMSALRPLREFGCYAVALTISSGLGRLVQPMFNAIYPRLSRFAASNESQELAKLYHLASQILAILVATIAGLICVYSGAVLRLWTGNAALSSELALPLTLLFAGAAVNGIMNIPYALQLAYGWTRLAMLSNLTSLLIAIPIYIFATKWYGMVGAASTWLMINLGGLFLGLPLMHRRLLRGELRSWYLYDILPPIAAAAFVVLSAKWLGPEVDRNPAGIAWLATVGTLTLMAATAASRDVRQLLLGYAWRLSAKR